jgi:hypothetical protein
MLDGEHLIDVWPERPGLADSLDEAKAAFRGGGGRRPSTVRPAESRSASAFGKKRKRYAQPEHFC